MDTQTIRYEREPQEETASVEIDRSTQGTSLRVKVTAVAQPGETLEALAKRAALQASVAYEAGRDRADALGLVLGKEIVQK